MPVAPSTLPEQEESRASSRDRLCRAVRRLDGIEPRRIDILVICTGNICRSPMAEALLAHRLGSIGVAARVHSVGLLGLDDRASREGVAAMAARGLDLSSHHSRRLTVDHLLGADLVLGMTREHVREAVLLSPPGWSRTYTLKELVRRAESRGPRAAGQSLDEWLAKVHAGRAREDLLGESPQDDVADPYGLSRADYEATAAELDKLLARLVDLAFRPAATGPHATRQEHA